jgi:hypothetical protein
MKYSNEGYKMFMRISRYFKVYSVQILFLLPLMRRENT